ncbi:hypothetical protein HPB50_029332 [Hyalomma asiaticum]|nr:hypothetical protein HPB50_029332 [Hyalomma asiaticum]
MSKLCERELHVFFGQAKDRLTSKPMAGTLDRQLSSIQQAEVTEPMENHLDAVLERLLSMLEPVCLAEQQFCAAFFGLGSARLPDSVSSQPTAAGGGYSTPVHAPSDEALASVHRKECQINEELRRVMSALFPTLEAKLQNFLERYDKLDGCTRCTC